MKPILFFLTLALLMTSCEKAIFVPAPDPGSDVSYTDHPRHAFYQQALEQYRQQNSAPGAILLIQRADEPLWIGAAGMANLAHRTPMRTNTPFRAGSITKMFVATAVLDLVERDALALDDTLANLLPRVRDRIPASHQITVRHLLGHLSGILDPPNESTRYRLEIVNDPERIDAMTIDDLLEEYVYGKPLHFTPGSAYSYSNTNYWLLGQIIESITGQSVQQILDERIFTPLGLRHTYLEERDDRNVARGYVDLYGDGHLLDVSRWDRADTDGKPDGGIISTAGDLAIFARALLEGEIVSPASVALMKEIQLPDCDNIFCEYGLGLEVWRTGNGTGYGHNGGSVGIEANLIYYPASGNLTVTYKNNGNGSSKEFLDDLLR